jgi:hypothetical protein
MQSVPPTAHGADDALSGVPVESTPRFPVGRFSTGVEQLPDSPDKCRVGRFCDGIEQLPDSLDKCRVGRFCDGIERSAKPSSRRVGSFADGYGELGRR